MAESPKQAIRRNLKSILSDLSVENLDHLCGRTEDRVSAVLKKQEFYRLFKRKWYDILSNCFYIEEFVPDAPILKTWALREFTDFDSFMSYLEKDPWDDSFYRGSCYFGYPFTAEEINKYHLDLLRVNQISFIKETIADYSYEKLIEGEETKRATKRKEAEAIFARVRELSPINSRTKLDSLMSHGSIDELTLSALLEYSPKTIGSLLSAYFCSPGLFNPSFEELMVLFGEKSAEKIPPNYVGPFSHQTTLAKKRLFAEELKEFREGNYTKKRTVLFDTYYQTYLIKDFYQDQTINSEFRVTRHFLSLDSLADYLNGDLRGANLSDAPIDRSLLKPFQTDDSTILPIDKDDPVLEIEKKYDPKVGFVVKQRWRNSNGETLLSNEMKFDHFFDFLFFLEGDLSDADLLMCDGLGRLASQKGIRWDHAKMRSDAEERLGLSNIDLIDCPPSDDERNPLVLAAENETEQTFLAEKGNDGDTLLQVGYISDIHLESRFQNHHCKTKNDQEYVVRNLASGLVNTSQKVNLFAGDIAHAVDLYASFIKQLSGAMKAKECFFVLGNHELAAPSLLSLPRNDKIQIYRKILEDNGFRLIQNDLFFFREDRSVERLSEKELSKIDTDDLTQKLKCASLIIFGGTGFIQYDNRGRYYEPLEDEQIVCCDQVFSNLYEKVVAAASNKNVIILTHYPWPLEYKEGFVYVNGHTHKNQLFDDGKMRFFADNQVGYRGQKCRMKSFPMDYGYDLFEDRGDGIHEISREEYLSFYQGINEPVSFNRDFEKLLLLKRGSVKLFLMQSQTGNLILLNGGHVKKVQNLPLKHYYDCLESYAASLKKYLVAYDAFQKNVSNLVKAIGGSGRIHGAIVDIDFFSHLFVNPLDNTITPYWALSMVDKHVYRNLLGMLKDRRRDLLGRAKKVAESRGGEEKNLPSLLGSEISAESVYTPDTRMYAVSQVVTNLRYTARYNIVRVWNEDAITREKADGKSILEGIIEIEEKKD